MPSFVRALELGADAIELDVHRSADGVVLVHHDPILSTATSAGAGSVEIADLTWEVLRQLELAPGVAIPTLDDVLDVVAGRATVYVEIKGKSIEREVVDVVRRHDGAVAIHSFDHTAIAAVRALAPDIATGLLFENLLKDPFEALEASRSRDIWPHYSLIDETLVRRAHDAGARVIAWTVNASAEVSRLVQLGVDGICTDTLALLQLM